MNYFGKRIETLKQICGDTLCDDTKESIILNNIIDILDDMGKVIDSFIEEGEEEEDVYEYSFICPKCGEEIEVSEDIVDYEEEITCPKCGNTIPVCATDFGDFNDEKLF